MCIFVISLQNVREIVNWDGFKCDICRLRNELDRNQFLHGNCYECIPEIESFLFGFLYRYVQSCGSLEPVF